MDKKKAKDQLVAVVRVLATEKRAELERHKQRHCNLARPDFIWYSLVQSFATMGRAAGWQGLISDPDNYQRITYAALQALTPKARAARVQKVFRAAKIRMPDRKAGFTVACFDYVTRLGGLEAAKAKLLDKPDRKAKIEFLQTFPGIGPKYARNIMMGVYHEDFRDSIALDVRIRAISEALGLRFGSYDEHESFYVEVAHEAELNGWELDRLLFNFRREVESRLHVKTATPGRASARGGLRSDWSGQRRDPMTSNLGSITDAEYQAIRKACEALPSPTGNYHRDNYVENLQLTVLDYQNNRKTIEKALDYFRGHHGEAVRSHETLRALLDARPNDQEAAQTLWGNNHWKRLHQLRDLMKFFEGLPEPVIDHGSLQRWAEKSDFEKDFRGKVKGLGFAVYQWLKIRVGEDTVKPDVNIRNFLAKAVNRRLSDKEAVAVLEKVAAELNRKAYELDWSIFEHETGAVTPI